MIDTMTIAKIIRKRLSKVILSRISFVAAADPVLVFPIE